MTQRTRYFMIGAAMVITLGVGTGLVAYYNGSLPLGLGQVADTELTYLPANSAAVGYADVRTIMSSQFREKLRQVMPSGEEKEKLQAQFGVDLERDIDSVTAAYLGGANGIRSAVVVVRGRFNDAQIETMAVQHGAVVGEYRGKRMLTMTHDEARDTSAEAHSNTGGLAFLEPGVLAMGEAGALKAAIDAGLDGTDIRKNDELMGLIRDLQGSGNAWFVGRFDEIATNPAVPQEIRNYIPPVHLFAASAHVNGGISGALRAEATDEKSAEQLRDIVRGGLAAARLMSGENPKMEAMLNSLQMTGTGKTVGLTFTLPAELLDILNGLAAAQQLGSGDAIKK
jgi:hypothetical protein